MEVGKSTPGGHRNFKVVQKIIAARPVFEIYDEQTGEKVAVAKQTWFSILRSTVNFEDAQGNKILTAKGGFFDKTFWLKDREGKTIAKLTRPWIALRKNFKIFYHDDVLKAQGGLLAWGFEANTSVGAFAFRLDKKILAIRDQFRVSVGDYMEWLHAVASAVVVDRVFFRGRSRCGCCICIAFLLLVLFGLLILSSLLVSLP